ncbi:PREDICTED: uncharacterized protein LOC109583925 [Amphimedon queenslandica]|uniref:Uncharacterized protein n=2 Tax=Amphimedon queenslandica TaxID=400682 RepID=A0AAN0JDA8_AMPQE|nr:PREDICTED: uncharacterized protein LOC109583925 [Amphimedon queenslandica]|eukprot:XP_019855010.1 PREDICTED: uncharacterized protein LOC109583925 [Amphimedon queenslandica]
MHQVNSLLLKKNTEESFNILHYYRSYINMFHTSLLYSALTAFAVMQLASASPLQKCYNTGTKEVLYYGVQVADVLLTQKLYNQMNDNYEAKKYNVETLLLNIAKLEQYRGKLHQGNTNPLAIKTVNELINMAIDSACKMIRNDILVVGNANFSCTPSEFQQMRLMLTAHSDLKAVIHKAKDIVGDLGNLEACYCWKKDQMKKDSKVSQVRGYFDTYFTCNM